MVCQKCTPFFTPCVPDDFPLNGAWQRLVHVARYALIYPVKGSRPRRVLLPSKDGWDPACGASASTEDLELGQWFRGPQKVNSVDYFPGTRCRLGNGYDIVFAKCRKRQRPPPINATILSLFSIRWPGALVIIKRARRDYGRVVHITAPEISLINAITQR